MAGQRVLRTSRHRALFLAFAYVLCAAVSRGDSSTPPRLPGKVAIEQKLNAQIPLEAMFRDESGKVVRLRQLLRGKPLLLNFIYDRCPMLCPLVQEGLTAALTELKFTAGSDFDILTVSIDPRDNAKVAAVRKDRYIKRYGRAGAAEGWHFLTGPDSAIKLLTNAVGFRYAYDIEVDQFAHGAVLYVLTPDGRVSRHLYGFEYKPRDLRLALVEASKGNIGSPVDQLLLLCFHYDPATGKYSRSAMTFVRAGGVATVLSLMSFIVVMIRRERHARIAGKCHPEPAERGEGSGAGYDARDPSPSSRLRMTRDEAPDSGERDAH